MRVANELDTNLTPVFPHLDSPRENDMNAKVERKLTLAALVAETGMESRRIRYYISQEVLPRAKGAGRGAYYTSAHLQLIERIKPYMDEGWTASSLKRLLSRGPAAPSNDGPRKVSVLWRFEIGRGIECNVDRVVTGLGSADLDVLRDQLQRLTGRFLRARTKR